MTIQSRRSLFYALLVSVLACHAPPPKSTPPPKSAAASGQVSKSTSTQVAFMVGESPVSLTAGDGTGLRLASMKAHAVVDGPLAFTELELAFENPNDRVLEGTFRIALPRGASLGRFAMKIEEQWQEGEVVDLAQARRAYEDFLHRKQDPALMEKAAGNEFSARVFPIPPKGAKHIIVAYTQQLEDARYTLPLRGLPELAALDIDVHVTGASSPPAFSQRSTKPTSDYVIDLTDEGRKAPLSGVRSGNVAIVHVKAPTDKASSAEPIDNAIVMVDTSASRSLGFERELDLVARVVHSISGGNATVAAFDQTVEPIFEGKPADLGSAHLTRLRDRGALGASDLERALSWAAKAASERHARRVIFITDGVSTAGATDVKKLASKVSALSRSGVERVDAVAVGGIRDESALKLLVRGTLPHDGVLADGDRDVGDVLRRLRLPTRSNIAVNVEGAEWSWPKKLDGVQAGDERSIYVTLRAGTTDVRASVGGAAATIVPLRTTARPLLERAVAEAKVASLLEREALSGERLKPNIVSIATQHRIMTPYTAMLVLETQADYAQYGIKRASLADVLAIRGGVIERVHRTTFVAQEDASTADSMQLLHLDADIKADESPLKKEAGPRAPKIPPGPANEVPVAAKAQGAASEPRPVATQAVPLRRAPRPHPADITPNPDADVPSLDAEAAIASERAVKMPYEGKFALVMDRIKNKQVDEAVSAARAWRAEAPGDVLALVALGEAAEARGDRTLAARAYGSIIDLFSNRADLRRFAGERLERLSMGDASALDLAIDSFEKAARDRPDHPSSHRLLALALLRRKDYQRAFEATLRGMRQSYEADRFLGVDRILREDLGLIGAAWARAEPQRRTEIRARVASSGGRIEDQPSLRFVLTWETDANDVDFHIHDARGGHAYYEQPRLASGGELYADVTTGYGPECFTIRGAARSAPYTLEAHYYSRGPMGYGMGKLEVIDHDGRGVLKFEERPFVVMVDQAFVDLGQVR